MPSERDWRRRARAAHRERSCTGKLRYRRAEAHRVAAQRSAELGEEINAYRCEFCHGWHIGHARPQVAAARSEKRGARSG